MDLWDWGVSAQVYKKPFKGRGEEIRVRRVRAVGGGANIKCVQESSVH